MSSSITSAMPSTPRAKSTPKSGIQSTGLRQLEAVAVGGRRPSSRGPRAARPPGSAPAPPAWPAGPALRQRRDDGRPDRGHRDHGEQERQVAHESAFPESEVAVTVIPPSPPAGRPPRSRHRRACRARRCARSRSARGPGATTSRRSVAASPLTAPSTPRLSKNTSARVSHWPGRMNRDSLIRVGVERVAGGAGDRRDPRGRRHRHLAAADEQPGEDDAERARPR